MKRILSVFTIFHALLLLISCASLVPALTDSMIEIKVTTSIGRISSEETEATITIPLEQVLVNTPSLHTMRSTSAHGVSTIWMQFKTLNAHDALQAVKRKVEQATSELPPNVIGPVVTESSYPQ